MKITKNLSNKYPKLFTDYKNRLFVFEKEKDGFLYFRVYQFWDRTQIANPFKITVKDLMHRYMNYYVVHPFNLFEAFTSQDMIAYSYMKDKITKYL